MDFAIGLRRHLAARRYSRFAAGRSDRKHALHPAPSRYRRAAWSAVLSSGGRRRLRFCVGRLNASFYMAIYHRLR